MSTDSKDVAAPPEERPWLTCDMCDNAFQPDRPNQRPYCSATCEANWMVAILKQQQPRHPRSRRGGL